MTGVSGDSREGGVSGTSGTGGCWRLASVLRDVRRSVLQFHVYLFIYFSSALPESSLRNNFMIWFTRKLELTMKMTCTSY